MRDWPAARETTPRPRVRVLSGLAALPVQLRFCLSVLGRRLFRARRYPLLLLSPRRGGFLATLPLLQRLRLTRAIRVGRRYHFSLVEPRWPSAAYDRLIARGGLNLAAAGTPAKAQIDLAILGITRTCPYRCLHCYERANLGPADVVPTARWIRLVAEMQEIGVSVVALSGGEPLSAFDRTLELLLAVDKTRSDFHLYTSGAGVSRERVLLLVDAGLAAAGVGLDDHVPARHDRLRARAGAFAEAVRAIELFAAADRLVYVNVCLTRELVQRDGLWRLYELADRLGAGAVQLLEPKPCGGYAAGVDALFGPEERARAREFFEDCHRRPEHARRPAVYYPALLEAPENLGCMMGGLSHLYVDSLGHVEPCVFLPVSFGNVMNEPFAAIFARLRAAAPRPLRRPCPAVALSSRVGFEPDRNALPVPFDSIRAEWRRIAADVDAAPARNAGAP